MINLRMGRSPRLSKRFPFLTFTFLIYLIAAGLLSAPARAAYMFSVDDISDYLKRIDLTTGAATPVGPTGVLEPAGIWGLSASPCYLTLYGAAGPDPEFKLWSIDITTGAGTLIGPFGYEVKELAYDLAGNVLYGTDWSNLFTVDQETGAATLVGPLYNVELARPLRMAWALDFNPASGRLYGVDSFSEQLFWADPATGVATLIGEEEATGRDDVADIAFDWRTGILYGVENDAVSDYFFRVDLATGATMDIGPLGEPIHLTGLAMPIPEPTTFILLGAGLLGLVKSWLRKKRGSHQ